MSEAQDSKTRWPAGHPTEEEFAEMSVDELDAWAASEVDWEHPEPITGPRNSVVSVRLNPGELEIIDRAATAAGMKLTTYIRAAALADAGRVSSLKSIKDQLARASDDLGRLVG